MNGPATDVRHRSFWLRQALPDAPDASPLTGQAEADVCIVGGGYVGMWTAYWLKQWDPRREVVILEQDICGGGASGRNGGFVLTWWAKYPSLRRLLGAEKAVQVCRQSEVAVSEIGTFCSQHDIDAHYGQKGWLWTARTRTQLGAWADTVGAVERDAPGVFVRL